jgi:hypothetical protein
MRLVKEILNKPCKITIYAWNNRYLIKLEEGLLEQTFKINETDLTSEADLYQIIDENFIQQALLRFDEMRHSLNEAMARAGG